MQNIHELPLISNTGVPTPPDFDPDEYPILARHWPDFPAELKFRRQAERIHLLGFGGLVAAQASDSLGAAS